MDQYIGKTELHVFLITYQCVIPCVCFYTAFYFTFFVKYILKQIKNEVIHSGPTSFRGKLNKNTLVLHIL